MTNEMTEKMTIEAFRDLVAAYGSKQDNWPAALRGPAMRLIERSDAAKKLWLSEKVLDDLLSRAPTPEAASADLIAKLIDIPVEASAPAATVATPTSASNSVGVMGLLLDLVLPRGHMAPRFAGALLLAVLGAMTSGVLSSPAPQQPILVNTADLITNPDLERSLQELGG